MINGYRVLAVIPARGGSKGLPNKNILEVAHKPLICWSIEVAKSCASIDAVAVSTDSEKIATVSLAAGAEVPFVRPPELSTDSASSVDVVLHCAGHYQAAGQNFDIVILIEPTSPLRESCDVDQALRLLIENSSAESVVSVCRVEAAHPAFLYLLKEDGRLSPLTADSGSHRRRQDVPAVHHPEGTIYASYLSSLRTRRSFYHEKTYAFEVPRWKAIEVDELHELICVDALLRHKKEISIL